MTQKKCFAVPPNATCEPSESLHLRKAKQSELLDTPLRREENEMDRGSESSWFTVGESHRAMGKRPATYSRFLGGSGVLLAADEAV
jgi:hypothetical protein